MQSRLPTICAVYGSRASSDLACSLIGVAGLFGNGDEESGGYNTLQEIDPTVAGSAGGYGWMQWTGPRRRAYLAWCAQNGLQPASDEANYRYTVYELLHIETSALRALRQATTVEQAATIVCTKYLRPGIPHLSVRIACAQRAFALLSTGTQASQHGEAAVKDALDRVVHETTGGPAPAPVRAGHWPEDLLSKFEIEAIQKRLLDLGYHVVGFVDGKWGERTAAALTALQTQARIVADGHYGPQSRAALSTDVHKAIVSVERAGITAGQLARRGNTAVLSGRKITAASIGTVLAGAGALAGTLSSGWVSELPWPLSMISAFLPPWVMIALVIVFNLYNALKATGLIGSAVERVREGIDNTGAPSAAIPSLPFGLDKLIPR